jgi:spermidine synthase
VRYSTFCSTLKYYNNFIHKAAFHLPEYLRRELEAI